MGRVRGYLVTGMEGKPISAICYVQPELELGGGRFSRRCSNNGKSGNNGKDGNNGKNDANDSYKIYTPPFDLCS